MNTGNNCFDSIDEFLDQKCHPPLPLVELPACRPFNPYGDEGVQIKACLGYFNPFLNLKAYAVREMLLGAKTDGRLDGVKTVVVNSSGNTAMALGILARRMGIGHVTAILPQDRPPGKGEILRLLSVEEKLVPRGGVKMAREMGKAEGYCSLDQYDDPNNPKAFYDRLAPDIWRQTHNGMLTVFCAALGTTGTVVGCSYFFRKMDATRPSDQKVHIVGVSVMPECAIPGARTLERLGEISLPWKKAIDDRAEVDTKDSYRMSLRLIEQGILAGPSSGLALVGLHRFLAAWREKHDDHFDGLRNKDGEVLAVVVFADTFMPYIEKYSTILDPEDFGGDKG